MRRSPASNHWSTHPLVSFARLLVIMGLLVNMAPPHQARAAAHTETPVAPTASAAALADQPLAVQYAVSSALGADDQGYHVRRNGAAYTAANPKQGTQAVFDPRTLQIKTGSNTWALDLSGWGRADHIQAPPDVHTTSLTDNRMEFDYGQLLAWYVNGPGGTQQGWTLQSPPAGAPNAPLTVALVQRGTLHGTLDSDRRGLTLHDASGTALLRYAGLMALDANHNQLPVWMELAGDEVRIRVDDRSAAYPITIDPYVAAATYENPGIPGQSFGVAGDQFGASVAVSADGRTVVVGAPYANSYKGRVYVFDTGSFSPLRAVFNLSSGYEYFGKAIAVSGDGKTILTSANQSNYTNIWRYSLFQGTWSDMNVAQLPSGALVSLALNSDGTASAIGVPGQNKVYFNGNTFDSPSGQSSTQFGTNVALSADGRTLFASEPGSNGGVGAIWYFQASDYWQPRSVGRLDGVQSMAVSADGRTIAASPSGGPMRVYTLTTDPQTGQYTYSTPAQLTASDGNGNAFATSVGIAPNGNTIVAGAPFAPAGGTTRGAVYIFNKPANGWANNVENEKLPLANLVDNGRAGEAVAISSVNVIVGIPKYNGWVGQLQLFDAPPRPVPSISAISPSSKFVGAAGFTLTLSGANFVSDSIVRWNGTALPTTFINDTTLQAQVPASYLTQPTDAPITVFTDAPGGGTSSGANFSVTTPTPVLTDATPYFGPPAGGTSVTLSGFNLGSASAVTFGGQPATIAAKTATSITVTTPAGASGDVDISVTTPNGATTLPAGFTYASAAPPVNYRDVGGLRIWANNFATQGDQTVATGRVTLGSAGQNLKYYQVSGTASWSSAGNIATTGAISFFDGAAFANGGATIDPASGATTWQTGAQFLIDHYGATSLQTAGPSIALNVLQPTVTVNTALLMALPENAVASARVRYTLASDGTTAAAGPGTLTLKMAGGTFSAPVQVTPTGLSAPSAQLSVPNLNTLSLPGITLTDSAGTQSLRIGAGGAFSVPSIALGGSMLSLTGLSGTLNVVGGKYEIALNGSLAIANFPENPSVTLALSGAKIAQGLFSGSAADASLVVAGNSLTLHSVTIQRYGPNYQLQAGSAAFDLPTAWGTPGNRPNATLPAVTLTTSVPYLKLQNTNFSVGGTFYQGGEPSAANQISFSNVSGSLSYNAAANAFTTPLTGDISIKLGQSNDGGNIGGVQFSYANGNVSATAPSSSIGIAGSPFATNSITYNGTSLTAPSSQLRLPDKWGNAWVPIGSLAISNSSFTIAGVSPENVQFALPEVKLGPLKLSDFTGHLVQVGTANSQVTISGQITFTKAKPPKNSSNAGGNPTSASVAGTLTLRDGHVTGTINEFSFEMSGFGFTAKGMRFSDDSMHADSVTLKLRIKTGDAEGTLSGITIGGPDEFSVGGGKFRIRDIDVGKVGIKEIVAEFQRTPDGSFWVSAAGKVKFPKFTIEAAIKISYDAPSDSVTINRVFLKFTGKIPGSALAVGTTGFYLTTVSGEFSLEEGTLTITLGVGGQHKLEVQGKSLLEIQGSITLQIKPEFELRSQATAKVLGYQIARVDMKINDHAFSLNGTLDAGMIHASLEVTFGLDAENEFTFYGRVAAEVTVPEGYFLREEIPYVGGVTIPWDDIHVNASLEGGKFRRNNDKVWGARGSLEVLGYTLNVMAVLSPNTDIILGRRMYDYQPVRPRLAAAAKRALLAQLGADAQAAAAGDLYQIAVGAPAERLTIIEVLALANRSAPTELQVVGPAGVAFTKTLLATAPDGSARIYTVDMSRASDAIGTWTVTTQTGNVIKPSGAIPPPSFESATLCPTGAACVSRGATATLDASTPVQLAWSTTKTYTDGLSMEAYATNSDGKRFNIAHQRSETDRSLSGTATWNPVLANGTYTVTLSVEDATSGPQKTDIAVVTFNDTTPPVAPANLQAQATADLAALLTWNGTAAEADVAGYQVSVDGGAPSGEDQRVAEYSVSGLAPGSTHTFTVAAYDLSGNLGPVSTVTLTLPTIGLTAAWPPRGAQRASVSEVGATFTRAIGQPTLRVANAVGQDVAGSTTAITEAVGITQTDTLGMMFVPTATLATGTYTSTISAWDALNQRNVTASWSFEVLDATTFVVAKPPVALAATWPVAQSRTSGVNEVGALFSGPVDQPLLTLVNAIGQPVLGSSTSIASDTPGDGIIGAKFATTRTLSPGVYTATITAWDPAAQQQLTTSWSFEVVSTTTAQPTPTQTFTSYLPLIMR